MKEKVLDLIEKKGLDKTAKLFGKSVIGLYRDFNLPITDRHLCNTLSIEILMSPEYKKRYEEYDISYDNFYGVVMWDDYSYSNDVGEDISMGFYCTPFYDGSDVVPIELERVNNYVGGNDYDEISYNFSKQYTDVINLDDIRFDTIDELIDWMNNDYKKLVYDVLVRIRYEIFENEIEKG